MCTFMIHEAIIRQLFGFVGLCVHYFLYTVLWEPSRDFSAVSTLRITSTLWTGKHINMFLIYILQNLTDCDKIW